MGQPINEVVIKAGKEALALLHQFVAGRLTREELSSCLAGLDTDGIVSAYWPELTEEARFVPHWQVLQTLRGLMEELDYQLREYGESTIYEDIKEIALSLKLIEKQK